jgi:hypothetical protein
MAGIVNGFLQISLTLFPLSMFPLRKARLYGLSTYSVRTSSFLCQTLGDADTDWRVLEAALAGLPPMWGEQTARTAHGFNDFLTWDGKIYPRRRHIGAGHCVHRPYYLALDAWHLLPTGLRVADLAQHIALCHRGSGGAVLRRDVLHVSQGSGGRGTGGSLLSLTSSLSIGKSGLGRL